MSQAEELLNSINEEIPNDITTPLVEEHIVIGQDRFIIVPEPLKRIAVQNDHKVETVTFDCPRYWDEHDLSKMYIYINYLRPDGLKGVYLAKNVAVDEADPNLMHFTWNIGRELTIINGPISFLVCAIQTDSQGYRKLHWNSEINTEMTISLGLESVEVINEQYPDIITDLLTRMDYILVGDGTVLDKSLTLENFGADAKVVGDKFLEVESAFDDVNKTLVNLQEQITSNDNDIENLQEQITSNDNDIDDLQEQVTSNDQDIINLQNQINNNDTDILNLQQLISLTTKYNVPKIDKIWDDYNYFSIDTKIAEYEVGMRVLIDTRQQYGDFTSSIIPNLDGVEYNSSNKTYVRGFSTDDYELFDKDDSTYYSSTIITTTLYCPVPIKPSKITCIVKGGIDHMLTISGVYGTKTDEREILAQFTPTTNVETYILDINPERYFTSFTIRGGQASMYFYVYEVDIIEGSAGMINPTLETYININNLGDVLIDTKLETDKYYELIYDGTVFKAREVI